MKKIDVVHTVGADMAALSGALPPVKSGVHADTGTALASDIAGLIRAGDVVMVKASLGTGLGVVVDAIKKLGQTG